MILSTLMLSSSQLKMDPHIDRWATYVYSALTEDNDD